MVGLSKLSQKDFADVLGQAIAARKAAEEAEKELKEELSRRGLDYILGATFEIKVSKSSTSVLDKKAVEETLGKDWVEGHTKVVEFNRVLSTIRKDVAANI